MTFESISIMRRNSEECRLHRRGTVSEGTPAPRIEVIV